MSWGVSKRLKAILGLVDEPMEYGAVEEDNSNQEKEMTPNDAFDAVVNTIPVIEYRNDRGGVNHQFDVATAEYRLARATLEDYKTQRADGQVDLVNTTNIRRGESPTIKADKEIFNKSKMGKGFLDLDAKAHNNGLTPDEKELHAALQWYDRNLNQPPFTVDHAKQVVYDYQEARKKNKSTS